MTDTEEPTPRDLALALYQITVNRAQDGEATDVATLVEAGWAGVEYVDRLAFTGWLATIGASALLHLPPETRERLLATEQETQA